MQQEGPHGSTDYPTGSLLTVEQLSLADVGGILASAWRIEQMKFEDRRRVLDGRTVALLFFESSTRTRTSFELAAKSLGATTTLVSDKSSSIEKGESLKDTGLTLRALGAEAIVLRHSASGAPMLLAHATGLPVLNAGDGMHQHPSQALLDLRTMLSRFGLMDAFAGHGLHSRTLDGVTVVITGDILHSRVARSNAILLPRLGAKVLLCGPEPLLPKTALELAPGIEIERDFDRALQSANVVMMLRVQRERLSGVALDAEEYIARYRLDTERLRICPANVLVMHPGPMIRGMEITGEVADGFQSAIEEQVLHGLAVRRALLARALGVRA
jgi:aspartate carbamoyltransferase catalytic subunit